MGGYSSTKCNPLKHFYSYFHNGCQSGVLVHEVSVKYLRGLPSFLLAEFTQGHSKNWKTVKFCQRSISVQPTREKVKSLKQVKLGVDTWAAKHTTTDNHYENSCSMFGVQLFHETFTFESRNKNLFSALHID